MFFFPFTLILVLLLIFLTPFVFFLLKIGLISIAFEKLGISPGLAFSYYLVSLLASSINIPIVKREVKTRPYGEWVYPSFFLGPIPQLYKEQIIAVNVGGCLIPLLVAFYLIPRVSIESFLPSFLIVTLASYLAARPVEGIGIIMPFWLSPLISAFSATIFAPAEQAAAVAFAAGVFGTLLGADILHLKDFLKDMPGVMSIGGAGVFDGIYLTGIIAAFLA
jgi:uncharacterized membrane protein